MLVRSEGLLDLEAELYNELIYIHRDPYLLIERTRDKRAELVENKFLKEELKRIGQNWAYFRTVTVCWHEPHFIELIIYPSFYFFHWISRIIGIYITLVLAISRILRFWVLNSSYRIMFEQLPNVDKILKLLNSIYIVRENEEFDLEEKLFSRLIFLFRSTEVMIEFTRPKPDPDEVDSEATKKRHKKKMKHNWAVSFRCNM